ncbi:Multidrug transporter (ABC) [Aspergillus mulundensis]|uniref:Multidrug transporter (ABC) n=1 Tax=Aspergillus mulundensis TaxID=1810919 RepID=A0A3D8SBS9_9EURO|nr:Multidrug transporter (ABC) [Aspergillus mulundensis]RDW83780.1 Multidrug transporter (ABC) [Aspergillus mulundensis]
MADSPWPQCHIRVEDTFGPQVAGCYEDFDFTLLFEESILYLPPLLIAAAVASLRLWQLRSTENLLKRSGLLSILKPLCWTVFVLLNLAHLVLSSTLKTSATRLSNAAIALGLAASPIFAWLSFWEHARSLRPSTILTVYLLGTIPMDAARARTLFRMPGNSAIASIFTTTVVCKVVLLVLEAKEKRRLLLDHARAPEETAGIFNRSFLWWFNPLLLSGYKQALTVDKLLAVDGDIGVEKSKHEIRRRWALAVKQNPRSLLSVLLAVYRRELWGGFLPRLCLTGLNYAQPFLVNRVVSFLGQPETETSGGIASGLIVAYAIVYMGIALMTAAFHHRSYRMVMIVRGGLILLIYDHTLTLNASSPTKNDSYTLITADVERIVSGLRSLHETWASLLEIALSLWLLEMKLRVSVVAAGLVVLLCLLVSGALSGLLGVHQNLWLQAMQKRLNATLATIGSIKGIKATGTTNTLYETILKLRSTEIQRSLKFRELLVALVTLSYVSTSMAPTFAFGTYSILAKLRNMAPLLAARTFSSLTIMTLLGQAVAGFVDALMGLRQATASLERIRQYLAGKDAPKRSSGKHRVASTDGLLAWSASFNEPALDPWVEMRRMSSLQHRFYNLADSQDDLVVLQDHTASWEASEPVLTDINVAVARGSFVMVIGPIGSGKSTLLHSMLGEVPHATGIVAIQDVDTAFCAQTPWLTNTNIRDNIVGVSHYEPGWYSAVVKACALHRDFAQLPRGDRSMIGSKGILLSGGQKGRLALARALYAKKTLLVLDDVFAGLDPKTEQEVFTSLFGAGGLLRQGKTTTVLATNSTRNLSLADYIMVLGSEGRLVEQGTPTELLNAGTSLRLEELVKTHDRRSKAEPERERPESVLTLRNSGLGMTPVAGGRRLSDMAVYKLYIRTIGWGSWWIFIVLCTGFVLGLTLSQIWLKFWTEANARNPHDRLGYYLSLYAVWSVLAITFFLGACLHLMLRMVPKVAKIFHESLLKTVMKAPLVYFSKTDSGEISNHFSQDLELIDMELPRALVGAVIALIQCISSMAVIVYSSNYLAAAIPGLLALLYLVQMFYLRTSQQLRVLELETRAPLLSHFMETIQGLVTLRAFGWANHYRDRHHSHLKVAQQSAYLLFCAQIWLTLTLDIIVAFLAVILVSIAATMKNSSAASIGLALVNLISFGANMKGLVYNWTALENAMGAIARVRHFTTETPREVQVGEPHSPSPGWPQRGLIQFKGVTASYGFTSPPVLNDVTITVQPGEKLAICGRTGCGKSSLVSSILRLLELRSGAIEIDGIDISTLSREDVRMSLNTLPQEPFFYHGTIRQNLDLKSLSSDEEILETLAVLGLRDIILKKGGLDVAMDDEFLSHGQQQLLCLARAMLKKSRILILDEVTSSVDQETEALITRVLRDRFQDQTVISIAHRLNTIMDYDTVIVLDKGCIVEQGNPQVLALQPSMFASLLQSNGEEAGDGDGRESESDSETESEGTKE